MLNIDIYKQNSLFKTFQLNAGEILFDEGEIDNNIYILESGELNIEKYTNNKKTETKVLAVLDSGAIFGEGALNNSDPKQVKISAKTNSMIVKISVGDFEKYISEETKNGIYLLSQIIEVSNKRLLEGNFLVTANYQISKHISEINEFNNKNLFKIINEFESTINANNIIYIEKNPVIKEFANIRYNSEFKDKMQNQVLELGNGKINLSEIEELKKGKIELSEIEELNEKEYIIEELRNGNEVIGFLIIITKDKFSQAQKKSITSISTMIAGVIKQKQYFDEIRDKEFAGI